MSEKIFAKLEDIEKRLIQIELQMAMFRGVKVFLSVLGIIFGIVVGLVEIIKK